MELKKRYKLYTGDSEALNHLYCERLGSDKVVLKVINYLI